MIEVQVLQDKKDQIYQVLMEGHAYSGDEGHDLVCASASTLGLSALNILTEICDLEDYLDYEYGSGYLKIILDLQAMKANQIHDSQIVLKGFVLNIESLVRQYPENISLHQEVRHD